jgi:hypothetical protein
MKSQEIYYKFMCINIYLIQNDFSKYQNKALFQIKLKKIKIKEENYVFLISLMT